MTEYSEGVTISEASVLQQVVLSVDVVQLRSNVAAPRPWFDQLHPTTMNLAVLLPEIEVTIGRNMVEEKGSLQSGVVSKM